MLVTTSARATESIRSVLTPVTSVRLPGRTTRFDYESIDPKRRLLFIAHLGDSAVYVVDLRTDTVIGTIPNVSRVHGILAVPELGRAYASATGTNELVVIDEQTLRVIARVPAGVYPDGIAYVAPRQKLYVSDEHGATDTVIDERTNKRIATIPLGGEAGNTQFDPISGHVFVNAQTAQTLIEIDPRVDRIVDRIAISDCKNNHGLLINVPARIAYIACDENASLLTFDLRTRKVIATHAVGDAPDVLAYDAQRRRLYIAAESGVDSVFSVAGDGSLSELATSLLADNAHSVAVDSLTGYTYFPIANASGKPLLEIFTAAH